MSEAELIEISQRFEDLRKTWERAAIILDGCITRHEAKKEEAEGMLNKEGKYNSACRIIGQCERHLDELRDIQDSMERRLESSDEDMERLFQITRKR